MQGMTKKTPGPEAPPVSSRPSLKMTALSYSWTTLIVKRRERGRVPRMMRTLAMVRRNEQRPGPSSQAAASRDDKIEPRHLLWV